MEDPDKMVEHLEAEDEGGDENIGSNSFLQTTEPNALYVSELNLMIVALSFLSSADNKNNESLKAMERDDKINMKEHKAKAYIAKLQNRQIINEAKMARPRPSRAWQKNVKKNVLIV
ncbi:hypothetical protein ACFE04_017823 [Oxalis oulophora]